ncbi:MAG: hypothetical protein ACHP7P_13835 [Terriglobales bacterium]
MPSLLTRWWRRFQNRVRVWAIETRTVCGFAVDVENYRTDIQTQTVVARLQEALELIGRLDPRRLRRLRHDVARFWIVRYPTRGAFFPDAKICMVELTFLARTDLSIAQIAACIVHEGAHARLHSAGVRQERLQRSAEERFCRRAELAFASLLPADLAQPVLLRASDTIAASDEEAAPDIDWAEAFRRQREVDIQSSRIPRWLKRLRLARIARERASSSGAA